MKKIIMGFLVITALTIFSFQAYANIVSKEAIEEASNIIEKMIKPKGQSFINNFYDYIDSLLEKYKTSRKGDIVINLTRLKNSLSTKIPKIQEIQESIADKIQRLKEKATANKNNTTIINNTNVSSNSNTNTNLTTNTGSKGGEVFEFGANSEDLENILNFLIQEGLANYNGIVIENVSFEGDEIIVDEVVFK